MWGRGSGILYVLWTACLDFTPASGLSGVREIVLISLRSPRIECADAETVKRVLAQVTLHPDKEGGHNSKRLKW